jgi:peptidoglycan glycosyltransferase
MSMRTTIRNAAGVYLAGFVLLALAAGYWQLYASTTLARDPALNAARLQAAEERVTRGRILTADGQVVADNGPDRRRVYARVDLAHVVGYDSARYGLAGVEALADDRLSGHAGNFGALAAEWLQLPRRGADVTLTIDAQLQAAAARALGGRPGAIVVLDVHTGAVLVMLSQPGFDPNQLETQGPAWSSDPATPLLNRATQGLYPPGSIFKTITLAGVLENGVAQPSTPMDCPAQIVVQGATIVSHNEPRSGGTHDLTGAYAWSCNTAFARLGLSLGAGRLRATAQGFGWEEVIPLGLPVAASRLELTPGFLSSDDVALAATAYGQGELLVTPLQMALVAAAVANRGQAPTPYLVQQTTPPEFWRRALAPATADQVAEIMRTSGRDGWARTATTPALAVAGKTGTAEAPPGLPHAWYLGFAPADRPAIAFAVVVEHGGSGSDVAGPIVAQMLAGWH